jgi:2-oxoglutarate dehydrogenase E2 component (dihydrolipoamide succinyltransferase)
MSTKRRLRQNMRVLVGIHVFLYKSGYKSIKIVSDVNPMMDGDYKIAYDFCDISIAVQDKGLMVPVVRNAENLTFHGVEADIKRLAIKHVMDRLLLMI